MTSRLTRAGHRVGRVADVVTTASMVCGRTFRRALMVPASVLTRVEQAMLGLAAMGGGQ